MDAGRTAEPPRRRRGAGPQRARRPGGTDGLTDGGFLSGNAPLNVGAAAGPTDRVRGSHDSSK